MNLIDENTVEDLQRQLEAANARSSQLEQLLRSQLQGDSSALDTVANNLTRVQAGFQLPSHGAPTSRSAGMSRSKSTISYSTQVKPVFMVRLSSTCAAIHI